MPTYDYRCDANGSVIEVKHGIHEALKTWGELCARAGLDPGATPANSPVQRLITGGQVVRSSSLGEAAAPACGIGPCCGGGGCNFN